ncbi:XRE family transcriptional regulator, partial [Enterococcus faecalis]|nr:XRE family transcriptional regulator [Enterococcus faecalis]
MRVRGQKIRAVRIEKKLSQKDLANEICTQATISNIEKKGICDSLQIFSRICNRLELDMNSCIIEPTEKSIIETLQTAEKLCVQLNHKKAYKLLLDIPENTVFSSDLIFKKLLYFRGI